MERWIGHVAFVTGASSGIGEAIAETLVNQGLKVVGFARRKERLDELAKKFMSKKGKFYPLVGDVSKEEDLLKAFQWTKENVGSVSIVINNAGVVKAAHLSESSTQNWKDQLDINVLGPCIATREAIKQMKENNVGGHVVNINSVVGHKVVSRPQINLYCASKYAVTALTETLRLELGTQKSKIRVTSISPGVVQTELVSEQLLKEITNALLQSSDIADAVVYALSAPQHVNITELKIQPVGETLF